ncbi:MAG: hypothetical protein IKF11_07670 [Methanobrevibacter sp.]|nr:hypothetical protein [Methanobrevibacter sp.]
MDKIKKFFVKIQIKNRQRHIDKLYAKHGLTDQVLEKQIEVNELRHKHDIVDESKKVYKDFVQ